MKVKDILRSIADRFIETTEEILWGYFKVKKLL
jgi:hypothetical protein